MSRFEFDQLLEKAVAEAIGVPLCSKPGKRRDSRLSTSRQAARQLRVADDLGPDLHSA
jgi:hypothetical protein